MNVFILRDCCGHLLYPKPFNGLFSIQNDQSGGEATLAAADDSSMN
jgi:hypothetical protein